VSYLKLGERAVNAAMLAAIAVGLMALARRHATSIILLVGPAVLALIAAGLRVYPFDAQGGGRLLLFLLPATSVVAACGLGWAFTRPFGWYMGRMLASAAALVVLIVAGQGIYAMLTQQEFPAIPREELRELITRDLLTQAREGDSIYVYYGAVNAFEYYAPMFRSEFKTSIDYTTATRHGVNITYGGVLGPNPADYSVELQSTLATQPSARFWVIFSHIPREREEALEAVIPESRVEHVWRQDGAALYLLKPEASADSTEVVDTCSGVRAC
jgi:hypothetical protein